MAIKLEVNIKERGTFIQLVPKQGEIALLPDLQLPLDPGLIYFLVKEREVVALSQGIEQAFKQQLEFTEIITLRPPWEIELRYLEKLLLAARQTAGGSKASEQLPELTIPRQTLKLVDDYKKMVLAVLATFGYQLNASKAVATTKPQSAKAQHRWTKAVSEQIFYVATGESQAKVIWQKRNELRIMAGAIIKAEVPLNKDGSIGFAAKMGEKLRSEHQAKLAGFVTKEDIILKSVNEVGLFLYFGGRNSWLELVDNHGKTIDEWAQVKAKSEQ